ncbi:MAG TPA: bifunctional diaminohydroxyphosphoribosylaminopyrimidine deaminase/5-amino-6-(5-phosphoribosylamino)uracil reductase RibD [Tepidisphaeraceae bacterium]|jgi:diaminohydroxyphosphoribosylaminopyrimidine deaminase/5-amino-6-(5-phosphoribosylamino)uracil reductase|nr:bifunctional diaminohydroxyphosphoribosylaminopyrimidine deaminase/5-amino-6-(5-phosphoribosylamino)uracil reductase RibD [Tepidisphaeraceae bacterium]
MADLLSDLDIEFLQSAVRVAMNGRGKVEPNPMVGCIIVKNGTQIGEGFHQDFGGPHAEPNALAACSESPAGATAYVTLEPCCHTNKKTPPCVPALIAAGVARVVVGCVDPNPLVAGRGIAQLREAGIVVVDANDFVCRQLIAPYVARIVHRRPYITLKWAQTADGKVAGPGGKRIQISNRRSQRLIHELRSRCDAIMVGIATARADDPLLTSRGIDNARPLIRIVLDSDLRLSMDSQLVRTIDRGKVVVFCSKEAADYSGTRIALAACGVEIHAVPSDSPGRLGLARIIEQLGAMNITHLLVEPGPTLAHSFLATGLWDRAWIMRSSKRVDDATAPTAANAPPNGVGEMNIDGDVLTEYLNPMGVYFGLHASSDFALLGRIAG